MEEKNNLTQLSIYRAPLGQNQYFLDPSLAKNTMWVKNSRIMQNINSTTL